MQSTPIENNILSEDSKKNIRNELDRILNSDLFSRSSVLSNFLKFIVEQTLEGQTDGLKEYTIAVSALGKSSDFNPQIDAIVRIHAGRLRRLLNEYYTDAGKEYPVRIELIKGTYVPVFRAQWIEDSGLIEADKSVQYSRSKLTLAVLPFRNLLSDNEYQFFVDGLGEELTRLLSRFQEIAVVAHYSARKYATITDDIRVIGSDLGVHYLISGAVKRSPDSIRVNVGLVNAMNGMQVWSQTYNHALNIESLLNIQDQIVENICSVLGGHYGIIIQENAKSDRPIASNIDSFDAAFWNYYFHMNYSEETYLKTREALENAIRHDPNYATGLAMLAELYLDAYSLGYPSVEDPVKEAFKLTKRAIRIDPQCQHAYQQYGWSNVYLQNKDEAVKALEYCLTLNPSSVSTMGGVGFGLACAGEFERAEVLLSISIDLNPHCPWWFYLGFFLVCYQKQDYEKALEYANKIETVDVFLDPFTKAAAKGQIGMYEEAQDDVRLLNEKYSEIMAKIYATLNAFLLDKPLIDKIIEGSKKAGLAIA